ncbi:MAG: hypothetical protein AAGF73_15980 [Actinomycetota bacterium]
MPKPYRQEFRDDVVKVARNRLEGTILEQIAKDFGIHPMTLSDWMKKAAIDAGAQAGVTSAERRTGHGPTPAAPSRARYSRFHDLIGPNEHRALTPLFWNYINPYGRFNLDMNTRLNLNEPPRETIT